MKTRNFNFLQNKAVIFHMNGKAYNLSPYDYTFLYNSVCYSGFSYSSSSLWILGDVFLGAYYSVYDKANVQLGLAVSITSSSSIGNSTFSSANTLLPDFMHRNVLIKFILFMLYEILIW